MVLAETLTICLILGASVLAVMLAKVKFQPAIEGRIRSSRMEIDLEH